jgi:hypothetical protein
MTTAPETETEIPQTSEELLAELAQLHIRTIVPPSPKQPAAFGWQAIAGCQAAGFARTLHALMQVAPDKAAEITDWYQGPFEEGPDPEEHTDWIERTVAKSTDVLDEWITEARDLAVKAKENTEKSEKERQDDELATLRAQVKRVRDWATSHEYRWLHELLDGYGSHGGHL